MDTTQTTASGQTAALLHTTPNGWQVRRGRDGVIYCTCPSWRTQKTRDRSCKHIRAYHDAPAVVAAPSRPKPEWRVRHDERTAKFKAMRAANAAAWSRA
jgi:hypothetical protein